MQIFRQFLLKPNQNTPLKSALNKKSLFNKNIIEQKKWFGTNDINLFVNEHDIEINNYTSSENTDEELIIKQKFKHSVSKSKIKLIKRDYWLKKKKSEGSIQNSDSESDEKTNLEEMLNYSDSQSDNSSANSDLNDLIYLYETDYKCSSFYKNKKNYAGFKNSTTKIIDYSDQDQEMLEIPLEEYAKITKITDFQFLLNLNKGGYGRVDLYLKKNTKDIYAIKTVNISNMVLYLQIYKN